MCSQTYLFRRHCFSFCSGCWFFVCTVQEQGLTGKNMAWILIFWVGMNALQDFVVYSNTYVGSKSSSGIVSLMSKRCSHGETALPL
jgi:hypothetical protein